MQYTTAELGKIVRSARKVHGVSQQDLAMTSGAGQRFISDLENGKATCQLGKVLIVLQTLGIMLTLTPPYSRKDGGTGGSNPKPQ